MWIFGAFCDLRNHVRTVSLLLNLGDGQQVNLWEDVPSLPQRGTAPIYKFTSKDLMDLPTHCLKKLIWKEFAHSCIS